MDQWADHRLAYGRVERERGGKEGKGTKKKERAMTILTSRSQSQS